MREIVDQLTAWHDDDIPFALATVVRTFSSAPRSAGAAMAVSDRGDVVGSISGGCVEAAVVEAAEEVLRTGTPLHRRFGVSDDDAFAIGLTCGGTIDVFIERCSPELGAYLNVLRTSIAAHAPAALATVIVGSVALGRHLLLTDDMFSGSLGSEDLDRAVRSHLVGAVRSGTDAVVRFGGHAPDCHDEVTLFVRTFASPPRMIVFGAVDFARPLIQIGKILGYSVTLCDARPTFATRARFPEADDLVIDWPHRYLDSVVVDERTVVCVLTHDPKFDIPLLETALRLPVAYIGAMGSRRTTGRREAELRRRGLTEIELERLHAPIGLDIGGRTPAETAISIAAEIISVREGRSGRHLRAGSTAIHSHHAPHEPAPPFTAAV
ncbi:XdhC family protein [Nocardia bovistercoris]|uniref:XdhC family protein n=1 Tax=Nocardia bovistercoris TaxID=2785916 RepID=A0A931I8N4_9NOCA|nr:XdhC/CoxI family protein [Nocardia bovistercoris]MBH0776336.1 XdhC family protein [Nocardia bovistercoris]